MERFILASGRRATPPWTKLGSSRMSARSFKLPPLSDSYEPHISPAPLPGACRLPSEPLPFFLRRNKKRLFLDFSFFFSGTELVAETKLWRTPAGWDVERVGCGEVGCGEVGCDGSEETGGALASSQSSYSSDESNESWWSTGVDRAGCRGCIIVLLLYSRGCEELTRRLGGFLGDDEGIFLAACARGPCRRCLFLSCGHDRELTSGLAVVPAHSYPFISYMYMHIRAPRACMQASLHS